MVFWKINYADFVHALHLTMFQPAHIKAGKTTKAESHEGNCREINGKPRSTIRPQSVRRDETSCKCEINLFLPVQMFMNTLHTVKSFKPVVEVQCSPTSVRPASSRLLKHVDWQR